MDDTRAVLHRVLGAAKRRFLLPPLPADLPAAAGAGADVLLAFCIESARLAVQGGSAPPAAIAQAFGDALAQLIRRAVDVRDGDPMFQAQVLHSRSADIREWAGLSATAAADVRDLRTAVDAFAHPGKLRGTPEHATRERLLRLHDLARAGAWPALLAEAEAAAVAAAALNGGLQAALRALLAHPALARQVRMLELGRSNEVQRYNALRAVHSPAVGSDAAIGKGRTAARAGAQTEQAAAQALEGVAELLNEATPGGAAACRVLRSLLTPSALAGADRSKLEWDAAIVRRQGEGATHDVLLLAEAKAAPAAATTDVPRLLRGLARLSQAQDGAGHDFACAEGSVRLSGASLRALRPQGHSIPEQVIYLCAAPPEARPALLGSAARALLLAEPASLRFAAEVARDQSPAVDLLAPVWHALISEGRLQSVLNQYDIARRAREAMLHPEDLSTAVHGFRHGRHA